MPSRHKDWLKQAERDLEHARHALEDGDFEWACFAAQQAAEKALKALYQSLGAQAFGHSVRALLEGLPKQYAPDARIQEAGRELDRHYIPARYPNAYAEGAPFEYYTEEEARKAVDHAERILRFFKGHLAGPGEGP